MASFFSFLSTFPSFPLPSLPQSLQRRLLSFLLRKSLGSFVKGGLDPEAIEADLSKGTVRVATLELENQAIDPLLADYPSLSFESGTIGFVTAQVTWPLSLSSTLSIDVEDVFLAFTLSRNDASNGNLDSSVDSLATETADHDARELDGSILSVAVASEFVKEELSTDEDAELRESLHLDSSSSDADGLPGAFSSVSKSSGSYAAMVNDEEVTMLASIIERLVSRLSFRVRRVRMRLTFENESGGESELEFRVEEVRYADETGANQESITNRVFRITSPSLHCRTPTLAKSTLSESMESTSSSDSSPAASDLMMSQSIADLRSSTASMYASATGGLGSLDEEQVSDDESSSIPLPSDDHCQICHFGNEEIVLSVTASRPVAMPNTARKESTVTFTLTLPQFVNLVLLPQQIRLLLEIADAITSHPPSASPKPSASPSKAIVAGTVTLHGINFIAPYEETSTTVFSSHPPSFWQHPLPQHLPASHLRLRLDSIALVVDQTGSTFSIDSFAVTEHLRSINGARSLPILISDLTIVQRSSGLSSFESTDWVMDKAGEARGWRTKPARVRRGPSLDAPPDSSAIILTLRKTGTTLRLAPLHIFLDLTIIPRLSPFLASLPLPRSDRNNSRPSTPRPRTPRSPAPLSPLRTASLSYQQPHSNEAASPSIDVECGLVRFEVRCPPPTTKRRHKLPWMESTRSGILVLDVEGLSMSSTEGCTKACWDRAAFFFLPTNAKRAIGFLSISALPHDDDDQSLPPFRPTVQVTKITSPDPTASRETLNSTTSIECRLPLIRSALDKPTLDGLQLFADDLTQWIVVASRDDLSGGSSSGSSTPNPRLVGSRYFGAKSFARRRAGSESDEGSTIEGPRAMTMKVAVSDIVIDLFPARKEQTTPRHLRALVSDLQLQVDLLKNSKNDMHVEATAVDLRLEDATVEASPLVIFSRTIPRNLTTGSKPLLSVNFTSAVEKETGRKESKANIGFSNSVYHLTPDLAWIDEIALFAKAPPGAFETVVPNELTRIRLRLHDATVYITPSTLSSRLVLSLAQADVSTDIMPDMPRTLATVKLHNLRVLAIDDERVLTEGSSSATTSEELWLSRGFISLVQVKQSSVLVRQGNGLVLPDLELLASDTSIDVSICADSIATVTALLSDLSPAKSTSKSPPKSSFRVRQITPPASKDMLSSVDQDAFRQAQSFESHPDYLNDDVPTNMDYLADALHSSDSADERSPTSRVQGVIISSIDGETIKMLDPRGIQIFDDFLAFPRTDSAEAIESNQASDIRCRLSSCDVKIHLHEGYDWLSTRKAIEEEAKSVRRRLERIRQLLSSGHVPDASAEEASTMMFGSIQLGLPPGAADLPPAQLLAAINEELNDASDTVSNASSWQPLSAQASPSRKSTTTAVNKKRRKLTRSRSYAIEVNLRGMEASFDTYPEGKQLASRTRVDFESFDIIDNIRSSTWRKFLTELRASDGGVARSSGASMVRFEMRSVRPTGKTPEQSDEILVKLKISPLRLYIDQDALDFLKAFAAFHLPPANGSMGSPAPPVETGPFFQRFEILPVKIKLDYKPKRVDYHALRRGKLAEMMNFFHFDGSEMTLRHLVLTGVTGSSRLSDLIQDIWTPDVKANQLADVISGIAPVRSVVNVGSGLANLLLLPIEQYRKDGRIGRGIQRGVTSFATSTTLEALNIGAKLSKGTQVILEQAEVVLGGKSSKSNAASTVQTEHAVSMEASEADLISRYAEQPVDLREGIESAYRSLGDNLTSAAQTILAVPMEVYERSGTDGPVRAVVRAVPLAIIKPLIGVSEGFAYTLLGLRNSLDPDSQAEAEDKYKSRQH